MKNSRPLPGVGVSFMGQVLLGFRRLFFTAGK